jgi:hypothetical protein
MPRTKKLQHPPAPGEGTRLEETAASPREQPAPRRKTRGRVNADNGPDTSSGEDFDLDDVPESSNDGEQVGQLTPADSHSPASMEPAAGSTEPTRPTTPCIALPPNPANQRNTAYDILHFFDRGSKADGTKTICRLCK